ncbi:RNA 2',3'-cyclic phosphodiesterase [Piscinibacter sakaiensis]|uniref:RNA 2',3'-cyclic phosphodiesterase n=1 Tax=Piscinibacter sakaiensis TaxID=1547922 RepID=UPI003AADBC6E
MPAPTTARLFIALWPDDAVRATLAACRNRFELPSHARPVSDAKLHLTLHFLGSVATERIGELADALQIPSARFELRLEQIDCWAGGLTVLRPRRSPAALMQLHADLAACLQRLAMPLEARHFRPHVTLARRHAGCDKQLLDEPIRWPVDGHVLVQSTPDGQYRVLQSYR